MKTKNNKNLISVLVIIIVALGLIYFTGGNSSNHSPKDETFGGEVFGGGGNAEVPSRAINYEEEFKEWRQNIRKDGPAKAYSDFKEAFAYDNFGTQHAAAHIFGEVLFDEEGIDGLVHCDSTFAFGCFHSFFGKALYVLGEDIIGRMDQACVEKYGELGTGCQHGIGHGLLQYAGYNNLIEALELCRFTTQKIPIFGCTSGVFMEYNVPLIDYGKGNGFATRPRELNINNPYEPCDELPHKFRESCYYEIGQWWNRVFSEDYKKIGQLCENIPDSEFRDSCYLGVGNVVVPTHNYILEASKKTCSLMPNESGELKCLAGASWSFFANPDYRELSSHVCEDLNEQERVQCAKDSDLTKSFD